MNNTDYIRQQLQLAVEAGQVVGEPIKLCSAEDAAIVVAKAKEVFVKDRRTRWWWEAFKKPVQKSGIAPEIPYFADYVPMSANCWLIIDDDSSDLPVVETNVRGAEYIVGELPSVEFYLVENAFQWLLAENHHGAIWLL